MQLNKDDSSNILHTKFCREKQTSIISYEVSILYSKFPMPKLGKKWLVGILLLQLTEQQRSIYNAGLYFHHEIRRKISALPKMKGLYFHLETSCTPYVFASPAQTSAITLFLQKNSNGALISSFPQWSNTLLYVFFLFQGAAQASETQGLGGVHLSHTAPLPLICQEEFASRL